MGLVIKSVVLTYLLALYFFLQNKLVLFGKEVFFLKIREYTYRGGVEREYIWNWIPIIIFIVMGVALIYFVIIPTSSTQTTTNTKDVEEIEEVDEDED